MAILAGRKQMFAVRMGLTSPVPGSNVKKWIHRRRATWWWWHCDCERMLLWWPFQVMPSIPRSWQENQKKTDIDDGVRSKRINPLSPQFIALLIDCCFTQLLSRRNTVTVNCDRIASATLFGRWQWVSFFFPLNKCKKLQPVRSFFGSSDILLGLYFFKNKYQ